MTIRNKKPDKRMALSLMESAKREMEFTLSLPLSQNSTNTIIRNIYENFRMLGEASLILKGIEPKDHVLPINEIINLKIQTPRPLIILNNFRKLRHNINYYGYLANVNEAEDIINFAKLCFNPIFLEIKKTSATIP